MANDETTLVCGCRVQYDHSGGQGHCWRDKDAADLPATIREEIEGEIIDGGREECDDFVGSNGCHYRWSVPAAESAEPDQYTQAETYPPGEDIPL